jgi:hypothetical protein
MINVEYPRRGFVVEEVIEGCGTKDCKGKKLLVGPMEAYGIDQFNDVTEGLAVGEHSPSDYIEGACPECGKPVIYKNYFVVTSNVNELKTAWEAFYYAKEVLNAPFPEGEALISTNAECLKKYRELFPEKKMIVKMMVAAHGSKKPDLYFCEIECTQAEYDNGVHYKKAEEAAAAVGYKSPMVAVSENDPAGQIIALGEKYHVYG